jgi:Na+/H+ antiporter NhaC
MGSINSQDTSSTSAFYFTRWFALMPLSLFILLTVALSLKGVFAAEAMAAMGLIGLILGSFFSRKKSDYWADVVEGLGDDAGMLVLALFLIVGIYGKMMGKAQVAEGLIWFSTTVNIKGAFFVMFTYVASALFGVATGTSLGTIFTMAPVLFPAAVAMGVSPAIAAGAILSGAATGDHFAPVSDTTILSSSTQQYRTRKGSADIGGVVRARMKYVIPAFLITIVLYFLFGLGSESTTAVTQEIIHKYSHAPGMLMLIPICIVLYFAIKGKTVFEALTYGIISGMVIGLVSGLLTPADILHIEGRKIKGIIGEGVTDMLPVVVMIMILMAAYHLTRKHGLIESVVDRLQKGIGKTPRGVEMMMLGVTTFLNFLLLGSTGRISIIAGPINDELGSGQKLHPYRRANICDACTSSFSYMMPWHIWAFVMIATLEPLVKVYPFIKVPSPTTFPFVTFYPAAIFLIILVSIITGFGRIFEGEDGRVIPADYQNEIPEEAIVAAEKYEQSAN